MAKEESSNSDINFGLLGVKLKVVGENLEVIREYQEKISLVSSRVEKSCKVSLYEGELGVLVFVCKNESSFPQES